MNLDNDSRTLEEQARIAMTFYRKILEDRTGESYPFGIAVENKLVERISILDSITNWVSSVYTGRY